MFKKILIANRGEIAVRIIRTCQAMGIKTVAVYSDTDFRSLHVTRADEAYYLGGARPLESYLAKEKILEIACQTNSEAIHPGYGFLSENEHFAGRVQECGLKFIGPPASVIAALGDKIAAKKLAVSAGLPVIPGYMASVASDEAALAVAEKTGFPILLKPAAGGGGKGMRAVTCPDELAGALKLCRQETRKAFGDEAIFIERYIEKPRHIEIQVLADEHGNIIHLGERECSIQRRYQKIIEECPSTALDAPLRSKMGEMACSLARKAGYTNAGTVEFILDQQGQFYFLEMNTRLQVEHPVTEMTSGLDLVEMQIRIAAGEVLPFHQEDVSRLSGWAIEARICAEDTTRGFIPSVGLVTRYAEPMKGQKVRIDSGIDAGSYINIFYDPMLAKVIVWGENRETARKKMVRALNSYHIEGVLTNVDFINRIITHPAFIRADLSTDFIPDHLFNEKEAILPPSENLHFMAIATALIYHLRDELIKKSLLPLKPKVGGVVPDPKQRDYVVKSEEDIFKIQFQKENSEFDWLIRVNGIQYAVTTPVMEFYRRRLKLRINHEMHYFRLRYSGNFIEAAFSGITRTFEIYDPREWELAYFMPLPVKKKLNNVLECPMPGMIVEVRVKTDDRVYKGQELVVIESMKMESAVASPCDGTVETVAIKPGDPVETGMLLMTFKL